MSITVDNPTPDCTNGQTVDITITNEGVALETIIFINLLAGMEWSDDGGSSWNSGDDSFNLTSGNPSNVINTDTTWNIDTAVFNGTSSVLEGEYFSDLASTAIGTIYAKVKINSLPSFTTPIAEVPSTVDGSPALGLYIQPSGKIWWQARADSFTRNGESSNTYNDGSYHEILIKANGASFGRFETELEGYDTSGISNFFTVDPTQGFQIGALQNLSRYNDIEIQELKLWKTAQTIATKSSTDGLLFELGWDATSSQFYNTQDGVPSTGESKTYKLRHNPEYISTNGEAYIEFQGSNTVQVTPTIDSPDMDLTNGQQKELILQNKSIVLAEDVDFDNLAPGVEYSEDAGSSWHTGDLSFDVIYKLTPSTEYFMDASGEISDTLVPPFIKLGTTDTGGDLDVNIEYLADHSLTTLDSAGIVDDPSIQEVQSTLDTSGLVDTPSIQEITPLLESSDDPTWDASREALSSGNPTGFLISESIAPSNIDNTTYIGRIEPYGGSNSFVLFINEAGTTFLSVLPSYANPTTKTRLLIIVNGVVDVQIDSAFTHTSGDVYWFKLELISGNATVSFGTTEASLSADANLTNISLNSESYSNVYRMKVSGGLNGYLYESRYYNSSSDLVFEMKNYGSYFVNSVGSSTLDTSASINDVSKQAVNATIDAVGTVE